MQALMLAAGKGSRLGRYTKDNTKCMLEVNGKTLLERCIDALKEANINKLVLVLGYKKDNVINYIKDKGLDKKIEIEYVFNEDYDITNNIYSLFLAKDIFKREDTILLESDLIYEPSIIKELIESKYDNAAVLAKYEQWMDGTVVTLDSEKNILEFIEKQDFDYDKINKYYKTVNIYKFSKEYIEKYYIPFLEAYVKAYGNNCYYELVLKVISGINKSLLKGYVIKNKKWYEIDDCQDLDISELLFSKEENTLDLYKKRFGGYWRFEGLKDYCYLVNPYFPSEQMLNKLKYNFKELISSYPSTLYIQNKCISRFFNIDEEKIIVGNGAAEIINYLRNIIKGKIGVVIPTFNEYIRCFPDNEIIEINSCDNDYKITKEMLLSYKDKVDNLIVINPDNPSGNFISKEDIMEIIDEYSKNDKKIIIDESFIDFADEDIRYSLLSDNILEKYKNLYVIKSIGKSYGIGGLRLGVLCSSDYESLKIMKEKMPVWNINSIAEYFLQIFPIYKKDYEKSCSKISDERKFMIETLNKNDKIKVYNSQANYLMCELKESNSSDLALYLLKNNNIFIKDLKNKKGFENKEMIRIAIKSHDDNIEIINAINSYLK